MMKPFLKKLLGFIVICFGPFLVLLLGGYLYYDPFKVLYKYSDTDFNEVQKVVFPYNRDYMATELFLKNYPKYKYNSFIFGSSRSGATKTSEWRKYLNKDAVPFSYNAAGESVYGIYKKLVFLDSLHVKLDNVLIILCRDWSFMHEGNQTGILFIKHPAITGESKLAFYGTFLNEYFDKNFLKVFYTYKLTNRYQNWMSTVILNSPIEYNSVTNEGRLIGLDSTIDADPEKYYTAKKDIFYNRAGEKTDSVIRITDKQFFMLSEIKRILEKNNTNYRIVCSPLYEQIKYHPHDKQLLTQLFGNNLFDFTGKNRFTDPITNYYESSHYRKVVGDSILNIIYRKN